MYYSRIGILFQSVAQIAGREKLWDDIGEGDCDECLEVAEH